MAIIYGIVLIFSCVRAVKTGGEFMTARDQFIKSEQKEYPKDLLVLRKKFLSSLGYLIVFILLLIFDL